LRGGHDGEVCGREEGKSRWGGGFEGEVGVPCRRLNVEL
jgi:hypothetical protein